MSFYAAEVAEFRHYMGDAILKRCKINCAVDAAQGQESKLSVVSFSRAGLEPDLFEFTDNLERLCVAVTRAGEFQILLYNLSLWRQCMKKYGNTSRASIRMLKIIRYIGKHVWTVINVNASQVKLLKAACTQTLA
ncbi:AAA-12 domain containing protein [Pyrenophora tritici-repentis]|nr:AAA-12 domain-containing protein [Pyrenophora tritici-repentis]KAI1522646.1 AAA-12 domain containing protein [Pyrenophora tritici-repentis]KAI1523164.1 AAA-12 domain containing protein [Pyrenophora tritici-repentis]KAI1541862.1 AAA-12 domain containing protein [Pyrenophora tritici-repentis]KAI1564934.1 AAA-12 domain containing protein [Pyrenophora tritici-repentis]